MYYKDINPLLIPQKAATQRLCAVTPLVLRVFLGGGNGLPLGVMSAPLVPIHKK